MGTTPTYQLPYPEPTDPADVPTDMHELALKTEQVIDGLPDPVMVSVIDAPGDLLVGSGPDAVARLAASATLGDVLTADPAQPNKVKWAPQVVSVGISLIEEKILGAAAANMDFQAIPATFRELRVTGMLRCNDPAAGVVRCRFNNDSGAIQYRWEVLVGTGAPTSTSGEADYVNVAQTTYTGDPANVFSTFDLSIPYYSVAAFYKGFRGRSGHGGTAPIIQFVEGHWKSLAALNRITFFPAAGQFVAGSRLSLYGIA